VDAEAIDENGNVVGRAALKEFSPFLEHLVQPSDTFEGICLRYKMTPSELRRANGFSGSNLRLAPNPLKIPTHRELKSTSAEASPVIGRSDEGDHGIIQRALTTDQVLRLLLKECPSMSLTEAKAYMELNDWDFDVALENAKEDGF
jgi:hypothetical protein